MEKTVEVKQTSIGVIEIRFNGSMYMLYINGSLNKQSSDYSYIRSEFDKM